MASVTKRKWTHNGVEKEAWVCRYFDEKGSRRNKTFPLKKDADAFRRKVERELEDGTHTADAEAATVAKISAEFLKDAEQRHRLGQLGRSRLDGFRSCVRKYILPALGERKFRDVKLKDVEDLYADMTKPGGIQPVTARDHIVILRMIERYARRRNNLKTQPVSDALMEIKGGSRKRVRTFSPEEVTRLLEVANHRGRGAKTRPHALMRCFVNLGAFCGLRSGEIRGLTLEHVDLERRVLMVRHSLTQYDELKGPKTSAGMRDVPMPVHVANLLRGWIEEFYTPNERELIFRTSTGGNISGQNYRLSWHSILKRAGMHNESDPHHFHALRHFTASWMSHNGLPDAAIAQLLGHDSFDLTLRVYVHSMVSPHMKHELVERMVTQMPRLTDARATQTPVSA